MFKRPILIFDEIDDDAKLLQTAIKAIDPLVNTIITKSKQEAKEFVFLSKEKRPVLVFVEIASDNNTGLDLVKAIKGDEDTKIIPTIVITKLNDSKLIEESFGNGVAGYMLKPSNKKDFSELAIKIVNYWNRSQLPSG